MRYPRGGLTGWRPCPGRGTVAGMVAPIWLDTAAAATR